MGFINNNREYIENFNVKSYESDMFEELSISSAMKYFQEIAGNHLSNFNMSYDELRADGVVFLLSSVFIKVISPVHLGQNVKAITWHKHTKGVRFIRHSEICDEDGASLFKCSSSWFLADPQTHKIIRPKDFPKIKNIISFPEKSAIDEGTISIKCPEEIELIGQRSVYFSDTDYNGHLNNTKYADIITDCLSNELQSNRIAEFSLVFSGEVTLGEKIDLFKTCVSDNEYIIKGSRSKGRCFESKVVLEKR